jgi:hypothetical protein
MKPNLLYLRLGRIACICLVVTLVMAQGPADNGAWAKANMQTRQPGGEQPIDMANLMAAPDVYNPEAAALAQSAPHPAAGADALQDPTLPPGSSTSIYLPDDPVGPVYQGPPPGSEGLVDNTQPDFQPPTPVEHTISPTSAAAPLTQGTAATTDLDVSLGMGPVPDSSSMFIPKFGSLDDFNRADGALGPSWIVSVGAISIVNQAAESVQGGNVKNLAIYPGVGANILGADISLQPGGGTQYSALVLNYSAGTNNLYIKVQDNNGDGSFDTAACYTGNGGSSFGLGFFYLSSTFTTAGIEVEVDSTRTVSLYIQPTDGSGGPQSYTCSGAPAFDGNAVGIGSYGGGRIDNLMVRSSQPYLRDEFSRQDGPLGVNWFMHNGSISIRGKKASSILGDNIHSLATLNGVGSNSAGGDILLSPGGGLQLIGVILNYDEGVNNLLIKVQDSDGDGAFDHGACYIGFPGSAFGLGYFALSSTFNTAHLEVKVQANRTVDIALTQINGGGGSQLYSCSGAPPQEGDGVGIISYGGGVIDNFASIQDFRDSFNRPDGVLGTDWITQVGSMSIFNGVAQGTGNSLATYAGLGSNSIEGDISLSAGGGYHFSAFVLNYGAGTNNLFIKVQDNNADGLFDTAGCYTGNNNGSGSFGLGFFNLAGTFNTAHLQVYVEHDRYVTLLLTRIDGGSGVQAYTCSGAPSPEGGAVGIANGNGGRIDNVVVNRSFAQDSFNRPDGAIGAGWSGQAGNFELIGNIAEGGTTISFGLTMFNTGVSNIVEGDVAINPAASGQYAGFALNYSPGSQFIFVKIQDNTSNDNFNYGACYKGNNHTSFGLGFFPLTATFTSAHMRVEADIFRNVTIILTRIDGGTGIQIYTCSGAPPAKGDGVGIVGNWGSYIDHFTINDHLFMRDILYVPWARR